MGRLRSPCPVLRDASLTSAVWPRFPFLSLNPLPPPPTHDRTLLEVYTQLNRGDCSSWTLPSRRPSLISIGHVDRDVLRPVKGPLPLAHSVKVQEGCVQAPALILVLGRRTPAALTRLLGSGQRRRSDRRSWRAGEGSHPEGEGAGADGQPGPCHAQVDLVGQSGSDGRRSRVGFRRSGTSQYGVRRSIFTRAFGRGSCASPRVCSPVFSSARADLPLPSPTSIFGGWIRLSSTACSTAISSLRIVQPAATATAAVVSATPAPLQAALAVVPSLVARTSA